MFNLIGFGEHAGSGVPDIFKAWKDEGLAKPEVDEEFGGRGDGHPDRTILTLPLFSGKHGYGTNLGVNLTTSGEAGGEASGEADLIQKVLDYCVEPRKSNKSFD